LFNEAKDYQFVTVDKLIEERRKRPLENCKDLLELMLNKEDAMTKEKLSDENIRFQLITFRKCPFLTLFFTWKLFRPVLAAYGLYCAFLHFHSFHVAL
jgi:hypothetical protein